MIVKSNNPTVKYRGFPSLSFGRDSLITVYNKAPPTMPSKAKLTALPKSTKIATMDPKKAELAKITLK